MSCAVIWDYKKNIRKPFFQDQYSASNVMESRSFDVLWLMFLELEVYEFFFESECSVGQVLFKDKRIGSLDECENFFPLCFDVSEILDHWTVR